jgi:ketosteroid isomerase-like protein
VHYEDPLTVEPLHGLTALGERAATLWAAFPDARVNATGPRLTDGEFASAPCKLLGTHDNALGRISATHRPLEVHAVVFAELREGRMLRVRAFFDVYGAGRQLGVLPAGGTAGERALLMLRGFGLRG